MTHITGLLHDLLGLKPRTHTKKCRVLFSYPLTAYRSVYTKVYSWRMIFKNKGGKWILKCTYHLSLKENYGEIKYTVINYSQCVTLPLSRWLYRSGNERPHTTARSFPNLILWQSSDSAPPSLLRSFRADWRWTELTLPLESNVINHLLLCCHTYSASWHPGCKWRGGCQWHHSLVLVQDWVFK